MKAKLVPWGSEGQRLRFWCEGCKESHAIPVNGAHGWQWNGDTERPTITPSILTTYGRNRERACHMYVTDGNAVFLSDCQHELAGQTVPLPDLQKKIGEEAI